MNELQLAIGLDRNEELKKVGKNWTCIGFVLDRSGSMEDMKAEAIGGYNAFVEKQAQGPDLAALTTVLFDHELLLQETFRHVGQARQLDLGSYVPRGSTALLDAMGETINFVGAALDSLPEEQKAKRVIIVTLTDGEENASQRFNRPTIEHMIKHQREVYSWEFIFLGAGLNSIGVARSYGIPATHAATMHAGGKGMSVAMDSVNCAVHSYRSGVPGVSGPEGSPGYTTHLASNKFWGGSADAPDKEA